MMIGKTTGTTDIMTTRTTDMKTGITMKTGTKIRTMAETEAVTKDTEKPKCTPASVSSVFGAPGF